ncbi:hypothetical protein CYMTET_48603 [Cymbomonas tetramitiformis]|uniref:Uncharacterized protein n=1 Tax=Cymbomonas tetramitiformis TaxID=36881 RepID=A0AAE0BS18_9CHLO|nr:hypothetical protein CYMTET_48603 [Cymbomonas tetramitiformis]
MSSEIRSRRRLEDPLEPSDAFGQEIPSPQTGLQVDDDIPQKKIKRQKLNYLQAVPIALFVLGVFFIFLLLAASNLIELCSRAVFYKVNPENVDQEPVDIFKDFRFHWQRPPKVPKGPRSIPRTSPFVRKPSKESVWSKSSVISAFKGVAASNKKVASVSRKPSLDDLQSSQLTVELFLSSQDNDGGYCGQTWNHVSEQFPQELVRMSVNYIGGGPNRDEADGCVGGFVECAANQAQLCAQKHLQGQKKFMALLECQSKALKMVTKNFDTCLKQVEATTQETQDIADCRATGEGMQLFIDSVEYSKQAIPFNKHRRGCIMRILDRHGTEKERCTREKGIYQESRCTYLNMNPVPGFVFQLCKHLSDFSMLVNICEPLFAGKRVEHDDSGLETLRV